MSKIHNSPYFSTDTWKYSSSKGIKWPSGTKGTKWHTANQKGKGIKISTFGCRKKLCLCGSKIGSNPISCFI